MSAWGAGLRFVHAHRAQSVHVPFRGKPPGAHGTLIKLTAVHAVITWDPEYRSHSVRAAMHRRRTE
jgi:hypothetical protein